MWNWIRIQRFVPFRFPGRSGSHCPVYCRWGDIVMVPDPCYPVFGDGPQIAGAELYYMPLKKENDYIIQLQDIPEEVARKAKLMVVSYPNNPTTAMAPAQFYRDLVAFAKKYDIIVLHDNAYSELVFDGKTCGSFLSYRAQKRSVWNLIHFPRLMALQVQELVSALEIKRL